MKACFMGLGYIGLPTAITAAMHGVEVVGVDVNPDVVAKTNAGELHIVEPGLGEKLREVTASQTSRHFSARNIRRLFYCGAHSVQGRSHSRYIFCRECHPCSCSFPEGRRFVRYRKYVPHRHNRAYGGIDIQFAPRIVRQTAYSILSRACASGKCPL